MMSRALALLLVPVVLSQQCPGPRPALLCQCDATRLSCSGSQTSLPDINLLDMILNYTSAQPSLVTVSLSVQGLSSLPNGAFSDLTQLRSLVISNTKYPNLNPNVFSGVTLHTLSLKFNAFTLVPAASIWHLDQLDTLDLSFNQIVSIRSDDFVGLSSLRRLDLSHNQISHLGAGAFTMVPNLVELMLQENLLENLENDSFSGLSELSNFFLSSNLFTQLDPQVFSPLTSLENLYLGHNPLGSLVRLELPSLKTLCMKNCSLCCSLDGDIFSGVPGLTVLMLSHNRLTSVTKEGLRPLEDLLWLDLSFNMLSRLQGSVFSSASHLLDMELQHNALQTLDGPVFSGLLSLENLNLTATSSRMDLYLCSGPPQSEGTQLRQQPTVQSCRRTFPAVTPTCQPPPARLRKLSFTCNYGAMTEEMIRDRLVLGIIDKQTKRQLISDPQLTLQKAIDVCKANESANKQIENLTKNTQEEVNKLNIRKKTVNQNKMKKNIPCRYCATFHEHNRQKCPAWNQTCRKCNKKNH
ncbi:K02A2.6-like [Cordylochernes scorpioides]|uniref:K02A2.6-like n=1 Tax=Cordylochernes scorpioides TaxID=51811 RepID=A0ABY6KTF3_9ARAC|nr:K02A2.6-like [Cordylochernes scorpioides]